MDNKIHNLPIDRIRNASLNNPRTHSGPCLECIHSSNNSTKAESIPPTPSPSLHLQGGKQRGKFIHIFPSLVRSEKPILQKRFLADATLHIAFLEGFARRQEPIIRPSTTEPKLGGKPLNRRWFRPPLLKVLKGKASILENCGKKG